MKTNENVLENLAESAGLGMLMTGVLILGPLGFLLLVAIFYFMLEGNLAMAVITSLLCASPVILMVIWALLKWVCVIHEHLTRKPQRLAALSRSHNGTQLAIKMKSPLRIKS